MHLSTVPPRKARCNGGVYEVLLSAAIALFFALSSPAAEAQLYAGYSSDSDNYRILKLNSGLSVTGTVGDDTRTNDARKGFILDNGTPINAIVANDTSIYFSRGGSIFQYTTAGSFVGNYNAGGSGSFGSGEVSALALYGSTLYAGYSSDSDNYRILKLNSGLSVTGTVGDDTRTNDARKGFILGNGTPINAIVANDTSIYFSRGGSIFQYTTAGSFVGSYNAGGSGSFGSGEVSALALTTSAVPEPASWALMIVGFGAAGATLRTGKRGPKPATVA